LLILFSLLAFLSVPLLAENAASLYNNQCQPCHGANGDGKTPAATKMVIPDLRGPGIQKMSDGELAQTIGNGTAHKQYPHTFLKRGLTPEQVKDLVGYIRSLRAR